MCYPWPGASWPPPKGCLSPPVSERISENGIQFQPYEGTMPLPRRPADASGRTEVAGQGLSSRGSQLRRSRAAGLARAPAQARPRGLHSDRPACRAAIPATRRATTLCRDSLLTPKDPSTDAYLDRKNPRKASRMWHARHAAALTLTVRPSVWYPMRTGNLRVRGPKITLPADFCGRESQLSQRSLDERRISPNREIAQPDA